MPGSEALVADEPRRVVTELAGDGRSVALSHSRGDHAALHGYAAMREELDKRFGETFFAWTPSLYRELGLDLEQEEGS